MSAINQLVDDLAAYWTEPAVAILKASGVEQVSVDLELKTWKNMSNILRLELSRQGASWLRAFGSVEALKEEVLLRATMWAAHSFKPSTDASEWPSRVRSWIRRHPVSNDERGLYTQMSRRAMSPARSTAYFPVAAVSAIGG